VPLKLGLTRRESAWLDRPTHPTLALRASVSSDRSRQGLLDSIGCNPFDCALEMGQVQSIVAGTQEQLDQPTAQRSEERPEGLLISRKELGAGSRSQKSMIPSS